MNCPDCGKEMEIGWMHSSREIVWSPKEVKWTVLMGKQDIDMQRGGKDPRAYLCRACQTVIVKYK